MMVWAEHRYPPVEKECLAIMFAVQKLRHDLVSHTVYLVSRVNPRFWSTKQEIQVLALRNQWSILLSQFDIVYVPGH